VTDTAEKLVTLERIEKIRGAINEFRDLMVSKVKDVQTEVTDWKFSMESHQEGVSVDIALKLLIKSKSKNE